MGYMYLILALIGGLGKGFLGKKISNDVNSFKDCIIVNILRMFFCTVIALVVQLCGGFAQISVYSFCICLLSAIAMTVFCVCWMYAYQMEAYTFLSVFTMLGSVITCFLSYIFLDEPVKLSQWGGIVLIALAIYIMSKYNKVINGALTLKGIAILIIGCLGLAVADFCQKICVIKTNVDGGTFNFYTYFFSLILLAVVFVVLPKNKDQVTKNSFLSANHTVICMMISVFLYLNTYAKTLSAIHLSSAQIYPVLQGANLICSALLARVLLKEKITFKSVVGMGCALVGIIVMKL